MAFATKEEVEQYLIERCRNGAASLDEATIPAVRDYLQTCDEIGKYEDPPIRGWQNTSYDMDQVWMDFVDFCDAMEVAYAAPEFEDLTQERREYLEFVNKFLKFVLPVNEQVTDIVDVDRGLFEVTTVDTVHGGKCSYEMRVDLTVLKVG